MHAYGYEHDIECSNVFKQFKQLGEDPRIYLLDYLRSKQLINTNVSTPEINFEGASEILSTDYSEGKFCMCYFENSKQDIPDFLFAFGDNPFVVLADYVDKWREFPICIKYNLEPRCKGLRDFSKDYLRPMLKCSFDGFLPLLLTKMDIPFSETFRETYDLEILKPAIIKNEIQCLDEDDEDPIKDDVVMCKIHDEGRICYTVDTSGFARYTLDETCIVCQWVMKAKTQKSRLEMGDLEERKLSKVLYDETICKLEEFAERLGSSIDMFIQPAKIEIDFEEDDEGVFGLFFNDGDPGD
jgi:hypothetical protein